MFGCIAAERNGPDVFADERLPSGALAEADLAPAKSADPAFEIQTASHHPTERNNMSNAFTGGCACAAIRYEISGEPVFTNHCQCRDCQRRSGTGHGSYLTFHRAEAREARRQGGALRHRRRQRQCEDARLLPGLRVAGLSDVCGDAGCLHRARGEPRRSRPIQAAGRHLRRCAVTPGTISIRPCRNSTRCRLLPVPDIRSGQGGEAASSQKNYPAHVAFGASQSSWRRERQNGDL